MTEEIDDLTQEPGFDSRAAILAAIPHRAPFLFVDEIRSWTNEEIVCAYRFKEDEYFFKGHYPEKPIVPGVVLCESAMQVGAILMTRAFDDASQFSGKSPVVGRMNDVKFKRIVRPGEQIEQRVKLQEKMGGVYLMNAKVMCEGKLAVSFNFAVTLAEQV